MKKLISATDIFASARNEHVITSLLDTDFNKFLLGQFIFLHPEWRDVEIEAEFELRSGHFVKPRQIISDNQLYMNLQHAQSLKLEPADITRLRGIKKEGNPLFAKEYLNFLKNFRLPKFQLGFTDQGIQLRFKGLWHEVTLWETFATSIISELYYYTLTKTYLNQVEFMLVYSGMIHRIKEFLDAAEANAENNKQKLVDIGTALRHSRDMQLLVNQIMYEGVPEAFGGTSNVQIAMMCGSDHPVATQTKELQIVAANMAKSDLEEHFLQAQSDILHQWYDFYSGISFVSGLKPQVRGRGRAPILANHCSGLWPASFMNPGFKPLDMSIKITRVNGNPATRQGGLYKASVSEAKPVHI